NLNYQEVQDPAVTVKAKIIGEPASYFLIWTTTPWTLPANLAIAVGADISYVKIKSKQDNNIYILAKNLLTNFFKNPDDYEIQEELLGRDLLGTRYEPIYKNT